MRRFKAIIFDFDGTLADSGAWFASILNMMAEKHRFRRVSDAEIEQFRSRPTREILRELGIGPWKLPFIAQDMRKLAFEAASRIRLFDGVPAMLRELRAKGVMIALVSSNGENTIRRVLGQDADAVSYYACGAGLFGKAAKFRRVCRVLKVAPEDVLSIGDEVRDIEAAREVGLCCAAVTWGYATDGVLEAAGPDLVFRSVDEIGRLIEAG